MMYLVLTACISTTCYSLCHDILTHVNEVERTNGLIYRELLTIQTELSRILENISPPPPLPLLPPSPPTLPTPPAHPLSPLYPPYPPEDPPSPPVPPEVVHAYRDGMYEHWIMIFWILLCALGMCYCCCSSSRPNRFNTLIY